MLPQIRFRVIHGVLVAFAMAILVRAAQVQIFEHEKWATRARQQQFTGATLPAVRGEIEDVSGLPIARSPEMLRLAVAPGEVKDTRRLYRELVAAGVPVAEARRATNRKSRWVELRRAYSASAVSAVVRFAGVHATAVGGREYVQSEGARRLLGGVSREGHGASGMELYLDSLLRGNPGRARTIRGVRGARFESPEMLTETSRRGHTVRLTVNQALQDICDKALSDGIAQSGAEGGDVLVLHPRTGELLCVASKRGSKPGSTAAAFIEPFEPGSTLKPFFAGRLLERELATPGEIIETFNGKYTIHGRTITDVHKEPRLSLADVIRYSSNVGIVRFTERLTDGDMYELLRDLGFGTPSGIAYPSEAAGTLNEPDLWSAQSHASLAIGYEIAVTPLQLAASYATIANGGLLVQPAIIREIRDTDDKVVYSHRPRIIRRVFEEKTTETLLSMLESVVDSGTAVDAGLSSFSLAGKSGTAWRTTRGRYGERSYTASFVALFPATSPQYVVLAKLDNPRGTSYYGGKAAAPIAKRVIEGALAARDASLDWDRLAVQQVALVPSTVTAETAPVLAEPEELGEGAADQPTFAAVPLVEQASRVETVPAVFQLSQPTEEQPVAPRNVLVPDVRGLPLRVAARELHKAGLRVHVIAGEGSQTTPPPGASVRAGTLVRLTRP
jgi:cell division protein FtsI (penicillin-binding protein 3)